MRESADILFAGKSWRHRLSERRGQSCFPSVKKRGRSRSPRRRQAAGADFRRAAGRPGLSAGPVRGQRGFDRAAADGLREGDGDRHHRGDGRPPHDGQRGHPAHDRNDGKLHARSAHRPHPGRGAGLHRHAPGHHHGRADEPGGLRLRGHIGGRGALRGAGRPAEFHDPLGVRAVVRGDHAGLPGGVHRGHKGQYFHDPPPAENAGAGVRHDGGGQDQPHGGMPVLHEKPGVGGAAGPCEGKNRVPAAGRGARIGIHPTVSGKPARGCSAG